MRVSYSYPKDVTGKYMLPVSIERQISALVSDQPTLTILHLLSDFAFTPRQPEKRSSSSPLLTATGITMDSHDTPSTWTKVPYSDTHRRTVERGPITPSRVKLQPFPEPKLAPAEKWTSKIEQKKARELSHLMNAVAMVQNGTPPEQAVLRLPWYNQALREGTLPISVVAKAGAVLEEGRSGANRNDTERQMQNLTRVQEGEPDEWRIKRPPNMQTRGQYVAQLQEAQPRIQAWYEKTAQAIAEKNKRAFTVQDLKEYIPDLSHEQLAAIESPAANKSVMSGAGAGKTTLLTAQFIDDIFNKGVDPSSYLFMSQTHSGTQNLKNAMSPLAKIMPHWQEEVREKQFRTLDSFSFKTLTESDEQGTVLQRMGFTESKALTPLYKGVSRGLKEKKIDDLALEQTNATEHYVRNVMQLHNISPRFNNAQTFDRYIQETKRDRSSGAYDDAFARGKAIYQADEWRSDAQVQQVSPDLALYLYEQGLHHVPGFQLPEQKGMHFDLSDAPYLVQKAVTGIKRKINGEERIVGGGNVLPLSRVMVDEVQDASKEHIGMLNALAGPNTRMFFAGDMGQKAIQNRVRTDEEIVRQFSPKGLYQGELTANYRQGPWNVAMLNAYNMLNIMEDQPRSPFQVAMGPMDQPPTIRMEQDFPQLYGGMIEDWMQLMGTSVGEIKARMAKGEHPLEGLKYRAQEVPFGFQMSRTGKGVPVFKQQLQDLLGEEFVKKYYTEDTPTAENLDKIHALKIAQLRSRATKRQIMDVTRIGLWSPEGFVNNQYTLGSRGVEQNHLYASMTNAPGNSYKVAPVSFMGMKVPPGYDILLQEMARNAYDVQQIPDEQMQPALRASLAFSFNADAQEAARRREQGPDMDLTRKALQTMLFLNKYYEEPVGSEGSGIKQGPVDKQVTDSGTQVLHDLYVTGRMDASTVAAQFKRAGDPLRLQLSLGAAHSLATRGNIMQLPPTPMDARGPMMSVPSSKGQDRLTLPLSTELLRNVQGEMGLEQSVPNIEQFIADMKQLAGPAEVKYEDTDFLPGENFPIMTPFDPMSMFAAPTEMEEFNVQKNFAPRNDDGWEPGRTSHEVASERMLRAAGVFDKKWWKRYGADEGLLRKNIANTLSKPEMMAHPAIQSLMKERFTDPRIIKMLNGIAGKRAEKNPGMARLKKYLQLGQDPDAFEEEFQKLTQRATPLSKEEQRQREDLRRIQEEGTTLPTREHELLYQLNQRSQPLSKEGQARLRELKALRTYAGADGLDRVTQAIMDPAHELNKVKGQPSMYSEFLKNKIEEMSRELIAKGHLDPVLMEHLATIAEQIGFNHEKPINKQYFLNMALKFRTNHGFELERDAGSLITQADIERMRKTHPFQAALLQQMFGDRISKYHGVKMEHASKEISQLLYHQGTVLRGLNEEQARKMGIPYLISQLAPAMTEVRTYFSSLEGGVEGNRGGILDPDAVAAVPLYEHAMETSLDKDFSFQQYGAGVTLSNLEKRYMEMLGETQGLHPRTEIMDEHHRQVLTERLAQIREVREKGHNPFWQLQTAHTLRMALRATTGEQVMNDDKTTWKPDPIKQFFQYRKDDYREGMRTLPSLVQLVRVLSEANEHLEQTGSLKRSHLLNILSAFGHAPDDKRFGALRLLEHNAGFLPTKENPDPSISMDKLIGEYSNDNPKLKERLRGELTRVPLMPGVNYQFTGDPATISRRQREAGIPAEVEGTLTSSKNTPQANALFLAWLTNQQQTKGQGAYLTRAMLNPFSNDDFGLSKRLIMHSKHGVIPESRYDTLNKEIEEDKANKRPSRPYAPIMQFQVPGAGGGTPLSSSFAVSPEQLRMAPHQPAGVLPWHAPAPQITGPTHDPKREQMGQTLKIVRELMRKQKLPKEQALREAHTLMAKRAQVEAQRQQEEALPPLSFVQQVEQRHIQEQAHAQKKGFASFKVNGNMARVSWKALRDALRSGKTLNAPVLGEMNNLGLSTHDPLTQKFIHLERWFRDPTDYPPMHEELTRKIALLGKWVSGDLTYPRSYQQRNAPVVTASQEETPTPGKERQAPQYRVQSLTEIARKQLQLQIQPQAEQIDALQQAWFPDGEGKQRAIPSGRWYPDYAQIDGTPYGKWLMPGDRMYAKAFPKQQPEQFRPQVRYPAPDYYTPFMENPEAPGTKIPKPTGMDILGVIQRQEQQQHQQNQWASAALDHFKEAQAQAQRVREEQRSARASKFANLSLEDLPQRSGKKERRSGIEEEKQQAPNKMSLADLLPTPEKAAPSRALVPSPGTDLAPIPEPHVSDAFPFPEPNFQMAGGALPDVIPMSAPVVAGLLPMSAESLQMATPPSSSPSPIVPEQQQQVFTTRERFPFYGSDNLLPPLLDDLMTNAPVLERGQELSSRVPYGWNDFTREPEAPGPAPVAPQEELASSSVPSPSQQDIAEALHGRIFSIQNELSPSTDEAPAPVEPLNGVFREDRGTGTGSTREAPAPVAPTHAAPLHPDDTLVQGTLQQAKPSHTRRTRPRMRRIVPATPSWEFTRPSSLSRSAFDLAQFSSVSLTPEPEQHPAPLLLAAPKAGPIPSMPVPPEIQESHLSALNIQPVRFRSPNETNTLGPVVTRPIPRETIPLSLPSPSSPTPDSSSRPEPVMRSFVPPHESLVVEGAVVPSPSTHEPPPSPLLPSPSVPFPTTPPTQQPITAAPQHTDSDSPHFTQGEEASHVEPLVEADNADFLPGGNLYIDPFKANVLLGRKPAGSRTKPIPASRRRRTHPPTRPVSFGSVRQPLSGGPLVSPIPLVLGGKRVTPTQGVSPTGRWRHPQTLDALPADVQKHLASSLPTPASPSPSLSLAIPAAAPAPAPPPPRSQAPSPEQQAVLDSQARHLLVQGGPGSGKSSTVVGKIRSMIQAGEVHPQKIVTLSAMHSGVEALNKKFNEDVRPHIQGALRPAQTMHALTHRIIFGKGDWDEAEQRMVYSKPANFGLGDIRGVLSGASEEDLEEMSPELRKSIQQNSPTRFLADALQTHLPGVRLPKEVGLQEHLSHIATLKKGRGADDSAFQAAMQEGTQHLQQGKLTSNAALVAYQQEMGRKGLIDFDDEPYLAARMLAQHGPDALPDDLKGTQLLALDEAQSNTPASMNFYEQFMGATGGSPRMLVGLDPMQSLFEGLGDLAPGKVIGSFKDLFSRLGGGQEHHQLNTNFRSDLSTIAFNNAILSMKDMKNDPGKSPPQVPGPQAGIGKPDRNFLANSDVSLYKGMFHSMVGKTGVPLKTVKENIEQGEHPFAGVDWSQKGMMKPSEIPGMFLTKNRRNFFKHVAGKELQDMGLSKKQASTAMKQLFRLGVPSQSLSDEKKEEASLQFPLGTYGKFRGLEFMAPHADVTRTGAWSNDEHLISYERNLHVGGSRVKAGGQNSFFATDRPFSNRQQGRYMAGERFFEGDPATGMLAPAGGGIVEVGLGEGSQVKSIPETNFARYQGQPVPNKQFAEILKLRDQSMQGAVPPAMIHPLTGPHAAIPATSSASSPSPSSSAPSPSSFTVNVPSGTINVQQATVQMNNVTSSQASAPISAQPTMALASPPSMAPAGGNPAMGYMAPVSAIRGMAQGGGGGGQGGNSGGGGTQNQQGNNGGGGGGRSGLNNLASEFGRTLARIGYEAQFVGKLFDQMTSTAVEQGSEYRRASLSLNASGPSGTEGFFDFTDNNGLGIAQLQDQQLPMYSKVQIAEALKNQASLTGSRELQTAATTDVLSMSALSGVDAGSLMQQSGYITGAQSQGSNQQSTQDLMGMLYHLFNGNMTAMNVEPTMQAISSVLPTMQGVTFGQGDQLSSLMGIFKAALGSGMTAQNLPDVAHMAGSLSQIGTTPDLSQQQFLNTLFPGQVTAGVQLAEYNKQQVEMSGQVQQMQLQETQIPQQIAINNAELSIQQANLQLSQQSLQVQASDIALNQQSLGLSRQQLALSYAQFGHEQQQQTELYGPIGADVSRDSYFSFMRNQQAAGYNPLSAETGTQFKSTPTFGVENAKFYAGVEHQRQDMVLSRSSLLSDAKFQEDQKYLNEQEAFYKEDLKIRNEDRIFQKDYQQKNLAIQGKQLDIQQKHLDNAKTELGISQKRMALDQERLKLDAQRTQLQNQQLALQAKNLPAQLTALQNLQIAMDQFSKGQGPVNGQNVTIDDIVKQLVKIPNDAQLKQTIQQSRIPVDQQNTLYQIIKQIQHEGGNFDKVKASTAKGDQDMLKKLNDIMSKGGYADQTALAAIKDAFLNFAGKGKNWQDFVKAFDDANTHWKDIATTLSGMAPDMKSIATNLQTVGPIMVGLGALFNGGGLIQAIVSGLRSGLAGDAAGGAVGGLGKFLTGGFGSVAGPIGIAATSLLGGWGMYNRDIATGNAPWWQQGLYDVGKSINPGVSLGADSHYLWDSWNDPKMHKKSWGWVDDLFGWGQQGGGSDFSGPDRSHHRAGGGLAYTYTPGKDTPHQQQKQSSPFDFKAIQKQWGDVGANIGKSWTTTGTGIGKWWNEQGTGISKWWNKTGDGIGKWWNQTGDSIGKWWNKTGDDIGKWWNSTGDSVGKWWNNAGTGIGKWWNQTGDTVGKWWNSTGTSVGKWWNQTADGVGKWWNKTGDGIGKAWSGMITGISDAWSKNVATPISDFFTKSFPKTITDAISKAFSGLNPFGGSTSGTSATGGGGGGGAPSGFSTPNVNTPFGAKLWYGIHQGVDFAAAEGTPLEAFNSGTVTGSSFQPWGGEIDVSIGGGLTERYLHLSQLSAHAGQHVSKGDFIGLTGGGTPASGLGYWSKGSHSHVQVDRGNINAGINPWLIWAMAGDRNINQFYGHGPSTIQAHGGGALRLSRPAPSFAMGSGGGGLLPSSIEVTGGDDAGGGGSISSLSHMLNSLPSQSSAPAYQGGGGTAQIVASSSSPSVTGITIQNLIGNATFTVTAGSGGSLSEQEQDHLMAQMMDILTEAAKQLLGKLS